MKKYIAIIGVLITVLPACVTYDKCVSKYGIAGDTTYIAYEVIIPKDSIITLIRIDSIPYLIHGDTHYIEKSETRAKIKYWFDMYNNAIAIQAECDTIRITDTIKCPPRYVLIDKPTTIKKAWIKWGEIAAFLIPLALILMLLLTKSIRK